MANEQEIRFIPTGKKVYAVRESSRTIKPGRVIGHAIRDNELKHRIVFCLPDGVEFGGGDWPADDLETNLSKAKKRIHAGTDARQMEPVIGDETE